MATTYGTPEESSSNEGVNLIRSCTMSELIRCCHKLGEMRSYLSRDHEESESKLKSLLSHTQEARKCVQILIDKHGLADTQDLAKVHLTQKDPSSSGGQIDERISAPKKGTETTSDGHNHYHKQVAPPQPSLPQQSYMEPPQHSLILQGPQQPGQSKPHPVVNCALFFRELITKSIHALQKVQADKSNLDHETKLCIHVDLSKTNKTVSFIDNGIGMTKADLEKELCTEDCTHGLLCSAFLYADKVLVTSKHNEDEQYVCEASRGDHHCFQIDRDDSETSIRLGSRGTKITLFLEDDHLGYLEECFLEGLVNTFFRYIDYDITIRSYDSSNKYQEALVHTSCSKPQFSYWYRLRPFIRILENYLSESFPDEVDAPKKKRSNEEKKKEFESLRKVMEQVLRNKVWKVLMLECAGVSPKMHCTVLSDPKSEKAIIMEINPWEPNCIWEKLAELAAEDSKKYYTVLSKMICELFKMAILREDISDGLTYSWKDWQDWPHQQLTDVSSDFLFRDLIKISIQALQKVKADDKTNLFIHIDLNKTRKTMSVIDNGIGMTKAVLENDGTHGLLLEFLSSAKKILVTTKHNEDEQYVCEASRGDNHLKIDRDDGTSTSLGRRGTKITLFLEDDHLEYLEERRVQGLVDRFFGFINYKISIRNYDSSNRYRSGLVYSSCSRPLFSSWEKVTLLNTTSEN